MKLNLKMMTATAQSKLSQNLYEAYQKENEDHSAESFYESVFEDKAIRLHAFIKEEERIQQFLVIQYFRVKLDIDKEPVYVLRALNYNYPNAAKILYKEAMKYKFSNLKKRVYVLNQSQSANEFASQELVYGGFPNPFNETPSYEFYLINCIADYFEYAKTDRNNSLLRKPVWAQETRGLETAENSFSDLFHDLNMNPATNKGLLSLQAFTLASMFKTAAYRLGILKPAKETATIQIAPRIAQQQFVMEI